MIERRDGFGLALEALARRHVRGQCAGQHLDGDNAIEPRVAAAKHFAHTAGTDGGEIS